MAGSGFYALRFTAGRFKGGEFPLRPNREIVVGRGSEYDMVLDEDMVSRRHAKIATMHGQIVVQDLKSTNGTFVNGERVTATRLKLGDKILIGTSIMELVEVDRSQPGAAATREISSVGQVMATATLSQSGPPSASGDIQRTEAAMPVLKLGPPPSTAAIPKATISPPQDPRPMIPSQPPGSLVPIAPAPEPPGPTRDLTQGLSGRFPDDDVSLPDLMELFHNNRRTGILVVNDDEGVEARLFIRDGKLFHATVQKGGAPEPVAIDATKAVYRVLAWPRGAFRFDIKTVLPRVDNEIALGTRELVIEGLRQFDELRLYDGHVPSREKKISLRLPLEPKLSALSPEALETLQHVLNEGDVGGVLDRSPASDLETTQDLLYLLQNGYIQVA